MDLGLLERVVVISGAGRGIGRVTALTFAQEGARVVVCDVDLEAAQQVVGEIEAAGGVGLASRCDVRDEAQVQSVVNEAIARFGRVDVMVNNAGISKDVSLLKMTEEQWDWVMDVNVKGTFHFCRAVLPSMRENKWGRIINLSSRSMFGNPGQTNYTASKMAIIGFTRSLSLEQARHGITVNSVAPGFVETEGMKGLEIYPRLREMALAKNPVGFLGEPKDIAGMITFLASEQARYVTGTNVLVTGGRFSS
ncbi:SDR family NAD(P)-dependent oxidoreductase [Diaphorobacter caeni]|uniref:SDR family NAD(P)-dependent oxidoreductase n=1 Tax=Diaphorobacter caeni TaxID=2784387 RepID=UPI00188FFB32|nr:SDR family NAD(P)-dependent oxidoreductase [Diaphorobacter caeni]MBF5007294.1 SDR family oxidoreductase [Diaphorobacter caeni]